MLLKKLHTRAQQFDSFLSFFTASRSFTRCHVLDWSWEPLSQYVFVLITATTLNVCVRARVCLLRGVEWRKDKIIKTKECSSTHFNKTYRAPQPQKWKNGSHWLSMLLRSRINKLGFPGGAVVESLPANAGDTGSSPGLGRSHMPRSNWARAPQLLRLRSRAHKPQLLGPWATITEPAHLEPVLHN